MDVPVTTGFPAGRLKVPDPLNDMLILENGLELVYGTLVAICYFPAHIYTNLLWRILPWNTVDGSQIDA